MGKRFPSVFTGSGPTTPRHFERSEAESRNLLSERFPMVMTHNEPMQETTQIKGAVKKCSIISSQPHFYAFYHGCISVKS